MPEPTRPYEDVPLWTPADRVRLAELKEALNSQIAQVSTKADADAPKSMADDNAEVHEASAALDAFVTEAMERARIVRVIALKRSRWRALKDAHPMRMVETKTVDTEGVETVAEQPHAVDEGTGFNIETIADELVPESLDPSEFTSTAALHEFLDDLSEPDFESLYAAALRQNMGTFSPPKAEFSSQVDRIIAAILKSPDPSD